MAGAVNNNMVILPQQEGVSEATIYRKKVVELLNNEETRIKKHYDKIATITAICLGVLFFLVSVSISIWAGVTHATKQMIKELPNGEIRKWTAPVDGWKGRGKLVLCIISAELSPLIGFLFSLIPLLIINSMKAKKVAKIAQIRRAIEGNREINKAAINSILQSHKFTTKEITVVTEKEIQVVKESVQRLQLLPA